MSTPTIRPASQGANAPTSQEIQMAAGRSFVLGFTASYLISFGNPAAAIVGGAVSTIASLIDVAIRPTINHLFGGVNLTELNEQIFGHGSNLIKATSIARNVMVICLTSAIAAVAGMPFGATVRLYTVTAVAIRIAHLLIFDGHSMGHMHLIPARII